MAFIVNPGEISAIIPIANEDEMKPSAICRGCLAIATCKSMLESFDSFDSNPESFADMLERCLGVKFPSRSRSEEVSPLLICDECIEKLKRCCEFKRQVLNAMEMFERVVKTELETLEPDQYVHSESDQVAEDKFVKFERECSPANSCIAPDSPDGSYPDKESGSPRMKGVPKMKMRNKKRKKLKIEKMLQDDAAILNHVDSLDEDLLLLTNSGDSNVKRSFKGTRASHAQRTREILSMMDQENLQCKICSQTFLNNRSLKVHINEHYSDYVCEVCGKGFALKSIYQNHFRRHATGEFTCRHCGETLPSKGRYDTHVAKHRAQKKYICKLCPERFTAFYAREKHMQDAHNIMKKYKCECCAESFLVKSMLDKHCRRHHSERLRNYSCELCGKCFYELMLLKRHMIVHTGERIYKCNECSKSYPRLRTLRDHMKIHLNIRNHVCSLCGKAFVQACSLRSHIRTHEKEKLKLNESKKIDFPNNRIETTCV